ncbi:MAG TPA: DUF6152 family protein [Gammaproteobacteria bacterium]|nr:DUF6152 family protein [Gammaproteobacteria bacterium]
MRTRYLTAVGAGTLSMLLSTVSAVAHHSFAAEFDASRPIKLTGVVKRMEFSNPHSWLYLDVKTVDGEVQEWAVEGAAPNALLRRGWNRNSLPAGTVVNVQGFQARDRSFRAAGRNVTLPDGSSLFVGSTGVGAPGDGATEGEGEGGE